MPYGDFNKLLIDENKPMSSTPTKQVDKKSFFEKPYLAFAGEAMSEIAAHKRLRKQKQAQRELSAMSRQEVERRQADAIKSFRESHPEMAGSSFEQAIINRIGQAAATQLREQSLREKAQKAEQPTGFERLWSSGIPGLLAGL